MKIMTNNIKIVIERLFLNKIIIKISKMIFNLILDNLLLVLGNINNFIKIRKKLKNDNCKLLLNIYLLNMIISLNI